MPLINHSIPNLINGVSQQSESLRLGSQAESQVNGLASVVEGLKKRTPTEFVKRISTSTTEQEVGAGRAGAPQHARLRVRYYAPIPRTTNHHAQTTHAVRECVPGRSCLLDC